MRNTNHNRRLSLRYLLRKSHCPIRIKSIPDCIELDPWAPITDPHRYITVNILRMLYGAPLLRHIAVERLNTVVKILN